MKKIFATILTILATGAAYALPVGNPADPLLYTNGLFWDDCVEECYDPCDPCGFDWGGFNFRFGYYGDFVFNRELETDGDHGVLFDEDERIDRTEIYTNAGLLVLNLWDRVDIFGTLGGTKFHMEGRADAFFGPLVSTARLKVETDTDFSWSVGIRGVLWECGCTVIGIEAQYFRATPDVRRITFADTVSVYPDDTTEFRYREWQVGLGIAHRINMFVPYFAVKWSHVDADFEDFDPRFFTSTTPFDPEFDVRQSWGYAFGVTLVDCDIMTLNVEGRLRDERAVAVNAQIRF